MLMHLPILPMPYSSSLYPELSRKQRKEYRNALKERTGCCFWCNRPFGKNAKITIDHMIPATRGGPSTFDNLVLCCRYCNINKGCNMPVEWLQRLEIVLNRVREMFPELV